MGLTKIEKEGIETLINNNADNRVITGSGTANTLNGEAGLTYDSGGMSITGDSDRDGLKITQSGNNYGEFMFNSNRSSSGNALGVIRGEWNSTEVASIYLTAGSDTTNKDDGQIRFFTSPDSGTGIQTRMLIDPSGKVGIGTDSPEVMLDIRANDPGIQLVDTSATNAYANIDFVGDTLMITSRGGSSSDGYIDFRRYDGTTIDTSMRITSAGDLLMGTTSASAFDSFGSNTGGIILDNVDASNTLLLTTHDTSKCFFGVDANYSYIWNESNHPMRFATNNTERMRITNGGRVDIGASIGTAHAGYFQVIHEGGGNLTNDCLSYFETNSNDWIMLFNSNEGGNNAHYHMYFMEEGTARGSIYGGHGQNITYNSGSDYRWKENIVDMTGAEGIEICKKLKPRKYNWIKNREGTGKVNTVDGFIAHEVVEAGVLGAVTGEKDAVNEDGSIDGQMLDYGQMTPVLAAGIKGLIAKIEVLETKVAALEAA